MNNNLDRTARKSNQIAGKSNAASVDKDKQLQTSNKQLDNPQNMRAQPKKKWILELLHVLAEDGIHRMDLDRITHFSSSGAHTLIHYLGREDALHVGKNLGRFEEVLVPFSFYRIHKSHIVNMQQIERYRTSKSGGDVEMENGILLPVSRLRKNDFLQAFRKMATVTV